MSISSTESTSGSLFPRPGPAENAKTSSSLFASRLERLMDQGLLKQDPEAQRQRDAQVRSDERSRQRDDVRSSDMGNTHEKLLDDDAEDRSRYDKQRELRIDHAVKNRLEVGNGAREKPSLSLFRPHGTSPELVSTMSGDGSSAFVSACTIVGAGNENHVNRKAMTPGFGLSDETRSASSSAVHTNTMSENGVIANSLSDVSSGRSAVAQGSVTMPVSASPTLPSQVISGAAALTIFSISGKVLDEDRELETSESPEPDDAKPKKTAKSKNPAGLFADILKERSSPRHVSRNRKDVGKDTAKISTSGTTASVLPFQENPLEKIAPENKAVPTSQPFPRELAEHDSSGAHGNPSASSRPSSQAKTPVAEFDEALSKQNQDVHSGEISATLPLPVNFMRHAADDIYDNSPKSAGDADETNTETDTTKSRRNALLKRVAAAVRAAGERRGPIRIRLHPESLGSIAVNIHVRENKLSATLFTTTEEARGTILDNVTELKNRLARLGMNLERFEVFLANDTEPPAGTPRS